MSLEEVRRSYWWASRYINSLYVDLVGSNLGVVSEYHTKTPFMQYVRVPPYDMVHPMGGGMMIGFAECDPTEPLAWQPFSHIHNVWSYVHNATRDYNVIAHIGFEDTEPDLYVCSLAGAICNNPVGDPFPYYNSDCLDPTMFVEYTRNRLKNGSFSFRQYLDSDPTNDLPSFWEIDWEKARGNVSLSSTSYTGPYSVSVNIDTGWAYAKNTVEVLPDTEYVLSWYFRGTIPAETVEVDVWFYDINNNTLGNEYKTLEAGEYTDWIDNELRFRTPPATAYAIVVLYVFPSGLVDFLFDMFWLSECPINLNPYYTLMAQLEDYHGEREACIFFGDTEIWDGVTASNIPRNIFETSMSPDGTPSFRSAIRHSVQNNVFYYKHSSMHQNWKDRSGKLQNFRDSFGYTYDFYHPLWRETDTYPDNFMFSHDSVHDCEAWFTEPRTNTFYPYWSKACMCRDVALAGLATKDPYFPALIAVHLMNKYGDPFTEAEVGYYGGPNVGFIPVSAYDLLFRGIPYLVSAVKDSIDPDKGWSRGDSVYSVYAGACALAAFAEIGYGFQSVMESNGYATQATIARDYADRLAVALLKNQWGYPFNPGKPGYFRHEDFGEINMPESAGGFLVLTMYVNGDVYATSRKDLITTLTDMFNMPSETPGVIPVNQETTFVCMRALQIYEWYKYKSGEGAFPKLLLPADVDGDGWVSQLDVAKVQFCIDNGIYDPLCDVNMDGVIDETDLNLVRANLGRGTPISGVIWTPKLSDEVHVEVM